MRVPGPAGWYAWNHGPVEDYADLNRASWDERAPAHAASRDYAVDRYASDTVSVPMWHCR